MEQSHTSYALEGSPHLERNAGARNKNHAAVKWEVQSSLYLYRYDGSCVTQVNASMRVYVQAPAGCGMFA